MPDQPVGPGPAPMEGHGGYNSRSAVQASGASPTLPMLDAAAQAAALPAGSGPVVVADYGASQGRNSLVPMGLAVRALRARIGAARAISVVHTDLPQNDFSALFELLADDPQSYVVQDPAAFPSAVGRSFYDQNLPADSVTLGWCAWSVQWLSRAPMPVPDHVHIAFSRDATARAAFAARAAQDWRTFLVQRGRELHPGGQLVVVAMAAADDGDFGYRPVMAAIEDTLQALVAEGTVQPDEAARMTIPTYGRTAAEFLAPFDAGPFGRLRLERFERFEGEDQLWEAFQRSGDAAAYGAGWAAFSRGSVVPTMALGLAAAGQPERVQTFVTRMEAGMARRLAAAPARNAMPLAAITMSCTGP